MVARAFVPGADRVEAATLDGRPVGELARRRDERLLRRQGRQVGSRQALRYAAANRTGEWTFVDPYSLRAGARTDGRLLRRRRHASPPVRQARRPLHRPSRASTGVHFAVWAPNARRVSVVGDFNAGTAAATSCATASRRASGRSSFPTSRRARSTNTRSSAPTASCVPLKADRFAFASELRPKTASVVAAPAPFDWHDGDYLERRKQRDPRRTPMSIYEVHLGSWRRARRRRLPDL